MQLTWNDLPGMIPQKAIEREPSCAEQRDDAKKVESRCACLPFLRPLFALLVENNVITLEYIALYLPDTLT